MNKILEIKNLSKTYNTIDGEVQVINNINLDVYEGDFIAIVGTSGCGKSSLLNILSGLDNDFEGSFKFKDNITCNYMLQTDCLFNWLTIFQNCKIGLDVKKDNDKNKIAKINELLKLYNLEEFKNKKPSSLSGGMKQRVVCIQ